MKNLITLALLIISNFVYLSAGSEQCTFVNSAEIPVEFYLYHQDNLRQLITLEPLEIRTINFMPKNPTHRKFKMITNSRLKLLIRRQLNILCEQIISRKTSVDLNQQVNMALFKSIPMRPTLS